MASQEEIDLQNCATVSRENLVPLKPRAKPKTPTKPKMPKEPKKPINAGKATGNHKPKPRPKRQETKTTIGAEPDRKILVAVDFGTTFSGIAWAQTRKPEAQTPIIQWPDATSDSLEGVSSDKVPTNYL